jgi:5'(3')-deoxyribonucleotidase
MSINRKTRIAIDMDEVIADTIGKFISMYKERHQMKILAWALWMARNSGRYLPPHLSETFKELY